MAKSILITGVAGSGKSSVCSELIKRGYTAFDIESIDGLFSTIDNTTGKVVSGFDNDDLESVKQRDWVCDKEKLTQLINGQTSTAYYCGTASNINELLPLFDKAVLLKLSSETVRNRLAKRKTQEFGNTPEIQDWVLSWKDWWEDHMQESNPIIINADQPIAKVVDEVVERLNV